MEEDIYEEDTALKALKELLTAPLVKPQVTALVDNRVYPIVAPDSTESPYLVFSQLDEQGISTKDGFVPSGWSFSVEVYADNVLDAKKLSRAVRRSVNQKTVEVGDLGKMLFEFSDEVDDYDQTRELITIGLNFRAYPTN